MILSIIYRVMETENGLNCYTVIFITLAYGIIVMLLSFENRVSGSVLVLNLFINKKFLFSYQVFTF